MSLIQSNAEKLVVVSGLVKDGIDELERMGIDPFSDEAMQIAGTAIHEHIPQLSDFQGQRIQVASFAAISIEGNKSESFREARVEGFLARVSLQTLHSSIDAGDGISIMTETHDLCALIEPRYSDPDPVDIVFGSQLWVPFSDIVMFEPV